MNKSMIFCCLLISGCSALTDIYYEEQYDINKETYDKYENLYQEMLTNNYVCGNHRVMFTSMIDRPYSNDLIEECTERLDYTLGEARAKELCTKELENHVYTVDDFKNTATDPDYGINGCVYSQDFVDSFIVTSTADKIASAKSRKEYEDLEKSVKKRFGYPLCSSPSIEQYISRYETFPKNCVTYTNRTALRVMQQVPDGTLCQSPYVSNGSIVLVQKNSTISQKVDGSLFNGYFIGSGTYQYTNVLGATTTIPKIKYLGN